MIRYTRAWARRVESLANDAFGDRYFSPDRLDAFEGGKSAFFLAVDGDDLLGYCLFLLEDVDDACQKLKISARELLAACPDGGPVCHTKSMAVAPGAQGNGVGERLFARCLADAVRQGARSAWGTAWKIGGRVPMDVIFRRYGFQVYREIPMVWFDDKEYVCRVCGGPCRCTGVVYCKSLDDGAVR